MILNSVILLPRSFITYNGDWLLISGSWDNTGIWRSDSFWIV